MDEKTIKELIGGLFLELYACREALIKVQDELNKLKEEKNAPAEHPDNPEG